MVDIGGIPMVATGGGYGSGDCGMGGGIWAILLLALLGGRGFGRDGDGYGSGCCQPATCQDVTASAYNTEINSRFNEIDNRIENVNQQGLLRDIWEKECCIDKDIVQQSYNLDKSILSGNYALNSSIAQNRFDTAMGFKDAQLQAAECCCKVERDIDHLSFQNAKETCEIMKNDDCNTQRIIDFMQCDKIKTLEMANLQKDLQLSQCNQNAYLVNSLRPYPTPSYPSCNPMASCAPYGGYGYNNGYGGGYGNNFRNDGCGCCNV